MKPLSSDSCAVLATHLDQTSRADNDAAITNDDIINNDDINNNNNNINNNNNDDDDDDDRKQSLLLSNHADDHDETSDGKPVQRHLRSLSQQSLGSGGAVELHSGVELMDMPDRCVTQVEHFAKYVWETGWKAMHHHDLPHWMKDNEFLLSGYRPPLPSAKACLASIFRMHTETVNIWTHLVGSLIFIYLFAQLLLMPSVTIPIKTKLVFAAFFFGAISCLICSTVFHIFSCHSCEVCKIFNKIDYCGISMLVMGSCIPWLYYAFHCRFMEQLIYMILLGVLGALCISVSLVDRFSEPEYRSTRAAVFAAYGLSAVIPCIHHMLIFGAASSFENASMTNLILMGTFYITGALLYANRIPERFFPGKCDIWGQSHQLFHVLVVLAATIHYQGILLLSTNHHRLCVPVNSR